MSGLRVVECLRPLVETKDWDYVVVWKYGDDPTRFIEWMGCCCRGSCSGNIEQVNPKEQIDEPHHLAPICRDTHFQHLVKTKACEALVRLPFAMSLYSGDHGEVAISQQPRWLIQEDSIGTQVLIPIVGGLIELFTAKMIPKDINIIEFITAHCCVSLKQEAISSQNYTSPNFNEHLPLKEQHPQRWPPLMPTFTPSVYLPAANQSSSYPSSEGPSSGSNPSIEHPSFDSKFVCLIPQGYKSVKTSHIPKTKRPKYNETSGKQQRGLSSHFSNGEEDKAKLVRESQNEGYHARNLVTERNRRNKIKKGLFTLRSLVPNITKMDRAAILGDAIDYIKDLQRQVKELQDEAKALDVQDYETNTPQLRMPTGKDQGGTESLPLTELNQSSSECTKKKQMEVQVEVHHIGRTGFLIKLYRKQKQGGFSRLMEAIHSFGLQVANVNMTTFDGKVLNILTVEATNKQDIHPTKLKEYLIQQTG
ncbi:transcription factor bHLH90 [Gastrolobium bilobum]|uniref:transcription factor bHLH90 n=1 Tax=Gastrolobium bilobum TaxID=150636 RepID=UPI002AAF6CFC|nr:transcription factor bHLH90 [Gastrolobium bilobum]